MNVTGKILFDFSPSYVSGADDSGFYDSYVHTDADDSDLSLLRKTELQGSRPTSTCSTPNRDAFSEHLFPLMEDIGTSPITSSTMYPFAFRKTKWPEQSLSHTASRDLYTSPPTKKVFSKGFDNSGNSAIAYVNSTNSRAVEYHSVLYERSFPPKSVSCTEETCLPKSSHGTLVSLLQSAPLRPENTDTALYSAKLPTSFPGHQPKQILLQDLCRIPQIALPNSKTTFTPSYESITDEVQTKDVTFASPAAFGNVKQEGAAVTSSTNCKGQGQSRQGDDTGGFSVPSKKFDKNNNDVCLTDNSDYGEADTPSLHKAKVPRSAFLDIDTNISEVGISEIASTPTEVNRSLSDRTQAVSASTETSSCGSDASMTSDTSSDESPPDSGSRDHPETFSITAPRLERSRKGSNPKRGAVRADPKFRGATVLIQTEIKDGCSQLQMSAFYRWVDIAAISQRSVNVMRSLMFPVQEMSYMY